MKNGLLIWNVVLTVIAGYLLFANFKGGSGKTVEGKHLSKDTSAGHPSFRIAYFEMDSIENHFEMVKDVKAEISKKEEDFQVSLSRLDNRYRNKYMEAQNAKSQAEAEKLQQELQLLGETLKGERTNLEQGYQEFLMRRNLNVKTEIEKFLTEYNKTKDYSYIVAYEQGLFYYKDTAYNITADVIRGLNEEYKKKKK